MISLKTLTRVESSTKNLDSISSNADDISEAFHILSKSLFEAEKEYSIKKTSERFFRFQEKAQSSRDEIKNLLTNLPIDLDKIIKQSFLHAIKNIITLNILRHKSLFVIMKTLKNNNIDLSSLKENRLLNYSESQKDLIEEYKKYIPYINTLMSKETDVNSMEYKQLKLDEKWALDQVLNEGLTLQFYCDVLDYDYEAVYNKIKGLVSLPLNELMDIKATILNHLYTKPLGTSIS